MFRKMSNFSKTLPIIKKYNFNNCNRIIYYIHEMSFNDSDFASKGSRTVCASFHHTRNQAQH